MEISEIKEAAKFDAQKSIDKAYTDRFEAIYKKINRLKAEIVEAEAEVTTVESYYEANPTAMPPTMETHNYTTVRLNCTTAASNATVSWG